MEFFLIHVIFVVVSPLQICYAANGNAVKLSCELLRNFVTGFYTNFWLLNWDYVLILCVCLLWHFKKAICVEAEAVQRAATIAEAEGVSKIEATHLERVLPQLLLDFWGIEKDLFLFFFPLLLFCFSYAYNLNP